MNNTPANQVTDPGLDEAIKRITPDQIEAAVQHVLTKETAARLKVYIDSCVHCGLCAEACHTYISRDGDPHFSPVAKVKATLDTLARFDLPIKITEFDMNTKDEAAKARGVEALYRVCFAHPAVEGVLMWGFWQGRHWRPDAALWKKDWTPTPAAEVYHKLVYDGRGMYGLEIAEVVEDKTEVTVGPSVVRFDDKKYVQAHEKLLLAVEDAQKNMLMTRQDGEMQRVNGINGIKFAADHLTITAKGVTVFRFSKA